MNHFIWLLIPLAPVLAALLLLIGRDRVAPWIGLSCLPALFAAIYASTLPVPSLSLGIFWPGAEWGAQDIVSRAFLGFTALLWGCASVYAAASQREHSRRLRFLTFWLLSLSGNLLLIIAQDGASFYVGFTLMSISAYGLIVHEGGPGPQQAGRLYLQLAILGEMLLYAALLSRIHEAGGSLDFAAWQAAPVGALTAVLLLIGFGLKAGFWPLHVWLPLAHPAAPAAASAVLSGAMIKAGILGLWRFVPNNDPLLQDWSGALFVTGFISAFFGVALGLVQTKAKAALAYSSISQVGYLLAILALAWQQPGARMFWGTLLALSAVHHGLAKGALFMGAGLATYYRLRRVHWLLMLIPAVALAGLPFTSGGVIKTLFKAQIGETGFSAGLTLLKIGALSTSLLIARALWLMRQTQRSIDENSIGKSSVGKRPAGKNVAPPALIFPWATLCLMPLSLPWLWPEFRTHLFNSFSLYASWALLWPIVITIAMALLVARSGKKIPAALIRLPNPARYLSIQLYKLLQRPPLPPLQPEIKSSLWRMRERRWNRFWQKNTLVASAWVLVALLLLGWVG